MIVRSYTGKSMEDALEKVRNDLGAGALIIESRSVREPGAFGRRVGYEVVAAGDPQGEPSSEAAPETWQRDLLSTLGRREDDVEVKLPSSAGEDQSPLPEVSPLPQLHGKPNPPAPNPPTGEETGTQASSLRATRQERQEAGSDSALNRELEAIRRQLARLAAGKDCSLPHLDAGLVEHLQEAELPAEILGEMDDAIASAGDRLPAMRRTEFCRRYLDRQLHCPGAIDWDADRVLFIVGPTGVGKTTTIAKLAGDLVLSQNRSVALVTIDTYRVGAGDQLQTYADLLDIPCAIARTPAELQEAIANFEDCDNILIDTAGRNPADQTRLHELKAFAKVAPTTVCLTLSATCGRAEFAGIVERFSVLPVQRTIITKLDECVALGRLYGCLRRHRLPTAYFTNGQEVPKDIVAARADLLTSPLCHPHTLSAA